MKKIKNKRIVIGLAVVVLSLVVVLIGTSLATPNSQSKIEKVDGLSFENAYIENNGEYSTFTVDVYNENKTTYTMQSIDIILEDKDSNKVTLTYEITGLESDEGRKIIIERIDYDLSGYSNISYEINK